MSSLVSKTYLSPHNTPLDGAFKCNQCNLRYKTRDKDAESNSHFDRVEDCTMAEQQDYTYDQQANGEGGFEQFEQQQQNAEPMEGQEVDFSAGAGGGGEGKIMDDDDDR